ncbi:hypothetical protein [Pseudaminobacter sp. NGMCC 1.201702]|uniref:hypothetical protein n=1 Tax=Pseudaminobacter sp. NGMCC 1.201702 TaxID=3391825 RepID=UPI0039EF4036
MADKLTEAKCAAYRVSGKAVMLLAVPFYVIDMTFDYLAKVVSVLCAVVVWPMVAFYDWCVKRHNVIRRSALTEGRKEGGGV